MTGEATAPQETQKDSSVNKKCLSCLTFTGDCEAAVAAYKTVLGAQEKMLFKSEDNRFVIHGSIVIAGVEYMVFDDPDAITAGNERSPVMTYVYVDDVAASRSKALEHGFKPKVCYFNRGTDCEDQFWGDTCASVEDPYGHVWTFAHKHGKNEKSEEMLEVEKNWNAMYKLP